MSELSALPREVEMWVIYRDPLDYWGKGGDCPPWYDATAGAALIVARAFVAQSDEKPRFALIDRDLALVVSLLDAGHCFCRNAAADRLIDLWIRMTRELGLEDGPTYMMLRAIVDELDLPYDVATIDELFPGHQITTLGGAPAGKA